MPSHEDPFKGYRKDYYGLPTQADIESTSPPPAYLAPGVRERRPRAIARTFYLRGEPVEVDVHPTHDGRYRAVVDGASSRETYPTVRSVWEGLQGQGLSPDPEAA